MFSALADRIDEVGLEQAMAECSARLKKWVGDGCPPKLVPVEVENHIVWANEVETRNHPDYER